MRDRRIMHWGFVCAVVSLILFQVMLDEGTHRAPFRLEGWRVAAMFVLSIFGLSVGLGRRRLRRRVLNCALGYGYCLFGVVVVRYACLWAARVGKESALAILLLLGAILVVPIFGWIGRIVGSRRPGPAVAGYFICVAALALALVADAYFAHLDPEKKIYPVISYKIILSTELVVVLVATLSLIRPSAKFVAVSIACAAIGYVLYVTGYNNAGQWFRGMTASAGQIPFVRVLLSGPLLGFFIWYAPSLVYPKTDRD